jgi:biopolymer transport protein ExbD
MAGASAFPDDSDGTPIGDINVTPLVDIVLVLLIVFMITMPTIVAVDVLTERELALLLPSASEATPLVLEPQTLIVNVDQTGQYFMEDRLLTPAEVEDVLLRAAASNPAHQSVKLRADRRVPVDYVVFVMNLCKKVGIADCQLTAEGSE